MHWGSPVGALQVGGLSTVAMGQSCRDDRRGLFKRDVCHADYVIRNTNGIKREKTRMVDFIHLFIQLCISSFTLVAKL
jgi:hypothetical protein